jgi:hypothetical protein
MTVDVDAVWANRDRNPVAPHPVNDAVPHPVNTPVKYVSPLTAYAEYERNKTNASTQLAAPPQNAAPEVAHATAAETTPVAEAAPSDPANAPTKEADPTTEKPANLLDSLPALKAAMESFEKRGDPIMVSADPEPSDAEPECERTAASIHTEDDSPEHASRSSQPNPRKRPKRKPRPIPTLKQLTVRPSAPRPQSQPKSQAEIDLSHHKRRCSICHHPDRDAIEEAFLQWCNTRVIQHEFKIAERAIYRHAHALKLFKQRNLSLRSALEFVIQKAEHVQPTAEGLVKAIHAYTRINDQGQWFDTPTTHIVKVMPIRDPEPRNVTPPASGAVTLDVKKISNLPRENRVEVTVESPSGRPLLIDSALPTETRVTPSKQRKRKFLTGARTHIRLFGKLANSVSKIWRRSAR